MTAPEDMTNEELIEELVRWHVDDDLAHCTTDEILTVYSDMLKNGWLGFNHRTRKDLIANILIKREDAR